MSCALYLALAGIPVDHPTMEGLIASVSVALAMAGALLETRFLVLLQELRDAATGRAGRGLTWRLAGSALRVSLFYTVVGVLLVASVIRGVLEDLGRRPEGPAASECVKTRYNPLLIIATLGLYLALFQHCASREAASRARALLEEPAVDLGPQGYEGE
jgi:hypothetical protein